MTLATKFVFVKQFLIDINCKDKSSFSSIVWPFVFLSFCLSAILSFCYFVFLSFCLSVIFSFCLFFILSFCLSVFAFKYDSFFLISVFLSLFLSDCIFVFLYVFCFFHLYFYFLCFSVLPFCIFSLPFFFSFSPANFICFRDKKISSHHHHKQQLLKTFVCRGKAETNQLANVCSEEENLELYSQLHSCCTFRGGGYLGSGTDREYHTQDRPTVKQQ